MLLSRSFVTYPRRSPLSAWVLLLRLLAQLHSYITVVIVKLAQLRDAAEKPVQAESSPKLTRVELLDAACFPMRKSV